MQESPDDQAKKTGMDDTETTELPGASLRGATAALTVAYKIG